MITRIRKSINLKVFTTVRVAGTLSYDLHGFRLKKEFDTNYIVGSVHLDHEGQKIEMALCFPLEFEDGRPNICYEAFQEDLSIGLSEFHINDANIDTIIYEDVKKFVDYILLNKKR